jgi:hypothetical protein
MINAAVAYVNRAYAIGVWPLCLSCIAATLCYLNGGYGVGFSDAMR